MPVRRYIADIVVDFTKVDGNLDRSMNKRSWNRWPRTTQKLIRTGFAVPRNNVFRFAGSFCSAVTVLQFLADRSEMVIYACVLHCYNSLLEVACCQACREPQRGPGKHYRGAQSPLPSRSVCLQIETPTASRGRKRGERCSLTIRLGVRGSVVSSPSGVRGGAPAEKWILCIF